MVSSPSSKARAIRASKGLWKAVDDRAVRDGISASEVIRSALVAYLKVDVEQVKPVTGRRTPEERAEDERRA